MSYIVVIPARLDSSRLKGKVLADIAGKPLIAHVVDRANESEANRVIVATDHPSIAEALSEANCEVCMTRSDHVSGSDRLAEVTDILDFDDQEIIVNVQGDEPLVPGKLIDLVASSLELSGDAVMSTAAKPITDVADLNNPNVVKVVFGRTGEAMYFSRAPIPYSVEAATNQVEQEPNSVIGWHHIGIYGYRAKFLRHHPKLIPSSLEQTEHLEQLRVLDNGDSILVETVDYDVGLGVDTQADLDYVRSVFADRE